MDHSKRGMSKKKSKIQSSKGRKGDDTERLVSGAQWTTAATQKFIECPNDDEKIKQLFAMFNITEEQYKHETKAQSTIDFHFSNGIWCIEQNLSVLQMQFVCRTLDKLLQSAIQQWEAAQSSGEEITIEVLRNNLFEQFHKAFNDINLTEWHFTPELTKQIIDFFNLIFFRPIRLILYNFTHERKTKNVPEVKTVFSPIQPISLSEFTEEFPIVSEEMSFKPIFIPKGTLTLEGAREMIQRYTNDMIDTINKRYDTLSEMISKVQPLVSDR